MLNHPNPALNEDERELLSALPEECLRRAVARGAISLDEVVEGLSPQAAAAVESIITGERVPRPALRDVPQESMEGWAQDAPQTLDDLPGEPIVTPDEQMVSSDELMVAPDEQMVAPDKRMYALDDQMFAQASSQLHAYPQLKRLLTEETMDWSEVQAAAQAVDRALGRYLTGTRYAAP